MSAALRGMIRSTKSTPRCVNSRGHGTKEMWSLKHRNRTCSDGHTNGDGLQIALFAGSNPQPTAESFLPGTLNAAETAEDRGEQTALAQAPSRAESGLIVVGDGLQMGTRLGSCNPRRRELVLVTVGRIRLPVLEVPWRDDCIPLLRSRRGLVTAPGYHKGRRSPTKGHTYPATPPTPEELHALLAAFPIHTKVGRRNQALTAFLASCGARISEALAVIPADIDLRNHMVTIRRGKGGKRGLMGIHPFGARYVTEWLDERAYYGALPHQPVFCSLRHDVVGGRMYASTFREAMAAAATRAGIDKRTAPHQLRHYLAVEMARAGVPLPLISKQLRHSNVSTTSTYLAGIAPVDVVDVLVNLPWPGVDLAAAGHAPKAATMKDRHRAVLRLQAEGRSDDEIARYFNVTLARAQQIIRESHELAAREAEGSS